MFSILASYLLYQFGPFLFNFHTTVSRLLFIREINAKISVKAITQTHDLHVMSHIL